jgi:hypothetical protein
MDSKISKGLSSTLESIYPEKFKMVHRVILNIYNKQIDATGYLVAEGNGEYRLLALGDLGNVFFDISSNKNKIEIHKNILKLSKEKFTNGVLKDIKAACLYVPIDQIQPAQIDDSHPVLKYTEGKETYLFIFNGDHQLQEYVILKDGQCTYKAEFKRWKQLPGLTNQIPTIIHTTNYKLRYTLTIDVIKFEKISLNSELLNLNTKDKQ